MILKCFFNDFFNDLSSSSKNFERATYKLFRLVLKSSKKVIKKHFKIIRQLFKVIKQHFRIINKTLQKHLYQFQTFIKVRSVNFFENDSCESKDVNF